MVKIGLKELAIGAVFGAGIVTAVRRSGRRYDFRERTVLITGGSRGLGLVMARAFADEGAGSRSARVTSMSSSGRARSLRAEGRKFSAPFAM